MQTGTRPRWPIWSPPSALEHSAAWARRSTSVPYACRSHGIRRAHTASDLRRRGGPVPPSQGGSAGSNPVGGTTLRRGSDQRRRWGPPGPLLHCPTGTGRERTSRGGCALFVPLTCGTALGLTRLRRAQVLSAELIEDLVVLTIGADGGFEHLCARLGVEASVVHRRAMSAPLVAAPVVIDTSAGAPIRGPLPAPGPSRSEPGWSRDDSEWLQPAAYRRAKRAWTIVGSAVAVLRANVLFVDHRIERLRHEPLSEVGHELSSWPNLRSGLHLPDDGQELLQRAFLRCATRAVQWPSFLSVVPRAVSVHEPSRHECRTGLAADGRSLIVRMLRNSREQHEHLPHCIVVVVETVCPGFQPYA